MARTRLWEAFQSLKVSSDSTVASAARCGNDGQHLLLKGKFGEPIFLFAATPRSSPRADVRLKHVNVSFDARFEVSAVDVVGPTIGTYCKFGCDSNSPHLHRYFVELMAATASANPSVLAQSDADQTVDALLELFRKLATPARRSVAGLWGELLLIHLASNPGSFIDAWHSTPSDTFDFAFSDLRVEVKTTERSVREHEFSLRQVRAQQGLDIVASVVLSRSAAGSSAMDLAQAISERVDSTRAAKLWRLLVETLGEDAEAADDQLFDPKAASQSVLFLKAQSLPAPSIAPEFSGLISDVRFKVNISSLAMTSAVDTALVLEHL